tara:strand:- start:1760 stop:1987 length:228 start_codon:yes stop_codon:yes gene_type:complete
MKYIYQVVREFDVFGLGTQQNVLGTYSTLDAAKDAADRAKMYGTTDEGGHVEIIRHELNPERVSPMNATGYPVGR